MTSYEPKHLLLWDYITRKIIRQILSHQSVWTMPYDRNCCKMLRDFLSYDNWCINVLSQKGREVMYSPFFWNNAYETVRQNLWQHLSTISVVTRKVFIQMQWYESYSRNTMRAILPQQNKCFGSISHTFSWWGKLLFTRQQTSAGYILRYPQIIIIIFANCIRRPFGLSSWPRQDRCMNAHKLPDA